MRRRIREAIVGVSAIILLTLGVPLAIVVYRSSLDAEVVELQATAAQALAEIEVPVRAAQVRAVAQEPDAPASFDVYDRGGRRVYGSGPRSAPDEVRRALRGSTVSSSDGEIVVATPLLRPGTEDVVGVLRVTEPLDGAQQRARAAWAVMAAAGAAALGLAWVIGTRLANHLARPLSDLAASAEDIGEVGGIDPGPPSGIAEIDELASALAHRAREVSESLQRERQFSADVSHQLRTPITALRLELEQLAQLAGSPAQAGAAPEAGLRPGLDAAIADVDRLEATVEHLLAVARAATPVAGELDLAAAVITAAARWSERTDAAGRPLTVEARDLVSVQAHRASVEEVLDVLIDNALRHGSGAIRVTGRTTGSGVAVDVADDGGLLSLLDAERVFERGHTTGGGEGIGLAVARSIAEADGARLLLTGQDPTTFSLLFVRSPGEPEPVLESVDPRPPGEAGRPGAGDR